MTSLTRLSVCSFPSLTTVGGIHWQTLPALSDLSFDQTITTADSVWISDTYLESLKGINLLSVAGFDVNNNKQLTQVNLQLANATDHIDISFNGAGLAVSLPNLLTVNNATFQACATVSTPVLKTIKGSIYFANNTFTSYAAPNLTTVGSAVFFGNNSMLTNISMPLLSEVDGDLRIAENLQLNSIDFPDVKLVKGAVDFTGSFENATLPAITDVRGGFNIQTTSEFDCSHFDSLNGNVIKGVYNCKPKEAAPKTLDQDPTGTSSGKPSQSSKSAAVDVVASPFGLWAAAAIVGSLIL